MSERVKGLRHIAVPEFVFGDGARHLVPTFLRNFGSQCALVVTDPGVIASGWTNDVLEDLESAGISSSLFSDVSTNPRASEIAAGAERYERDGCDSVVAVGGGSVIDCAKGIGIAFAHGSDVLSYSGVDVVDQPTPPLICVSTTTTSADVSQFAIVSDPDRRSKFAIISKMIIPDISLLDPVVYATLPPDMTAMGGMDCLSQSIEAYVSNAHSPFTDLLALDATRLVWTTLPSAYEEPDNLVYRSDLMYGNLEGGIAFSNASLGLIHALAHAVGGLTDAHHGACISAVLPEVIRYNYPAAAWRYGQLAGAVGLELKSKPVDEAASAFVAAIETLQERISARLTLTDLGLTKGDIPMLVDRALSDPTLLTNPRPAEASDIEAVYERSF